MADPRMNEQFGQPPRTWTGHGARVGSTSGVLPSSAAATYPRQEHLRALKPVAPENRHTPLNACRIQAHRRAVWLLLLAIGFVSEMGCVLLAQAPTVTKPP